MQPREMVLPFNVPMLVAYLVVVVQANSSRPRMPLMQVDSFQNATNTALSSQFTLSSSALSLDPIASTSLSSSPNTTSSQVTRSNDSSTVVQVSISFTQLPTSTVFVTEVVTAFRATTVESTRSSVVTVIVTETATAKPVTASPSSWDNRTMWAAPHQMNDLSAFNVTYFPSGQRNLQIVTQIPSKAIAPAAKFLSDPLFSTPNFTILQLVYPAHSVNPGSKPAGGADFYATPLNLSSARNVTLEYSVFFPIDFDWVKGGKLPGLFGGHTGCSGGVSARDCFSTRLMWRPNGIGELYLYAPKDKQTDALCADVSSVCDAIYGFSVGRGTFNFTAGDWTHLSQNVVLNTPGRNDGGFKLLVDGRPVIDRTDIFYRDVAQVARKNKSIPKGTAVAFDEDEGALQPAEFLGLFFSTFFGGHGKQYATPKQQFTWFKDFAITRHD